MTSVYDSNAGRVVAAYRHIANSQYGTANVIDFDGNPSSNFIGITAKAISNTATGAVNVYGGINTAQTGLTIGADYYVQADGSLGSPTVSVPYNIAGSTYVQSLSVSAQETTPEGITFNTNGH